MDESGPRETRLLKRAIEEFFHDSTQTPMTESLLMAEPLLLLWVSAHSGGKQAPKIGDCVCCPSCFIRNRSLRILLPCLFLFAEEPLESSNLYHQRHEQNEKSHPGCPLLKALLLLVTTLESKLPAWKNLCLGHTQALSKPQKSSSPVCDWENRLEKIIFSALPSQEFVLQD